MNISAPVGLLVGIGVVYLAAFGEAKNVAILLNPNAAIIVVGGTLGAALICFPLVFFRDMVVTFVRTVTGQRLAETRRTIEEIVRVAKTIYDGEGIEEQSRAAKNAFFAESLQLLARGGLSAQELDEVLAKRLEAQNEKYRQNSLTFKTVGKFPPAFGLVGTTLGMIGLLQGLGNVDAFQSLGPTMSLALVATFYGLVLSNVLLIPLGEHMNQASEEDLRMRRIVLDGVRLIRQKKHPLLVEEYLRSYLTPRERNRSKRVVDEDLAA